MELLDNLYFMARTRFLCFLNDFKENEMGVSSIVATVLLILVVVLLVSIFWGLISGWLADTWNRIIGADTIGS